MALIYCIVSLVLGVGSFESLVVETYASFYLLNCISHVWQVIWVYLKQYKLLFLGWGGQDYREQ